MVRDFVFPAWQVSRAVEQRPRYEALALESVRRFLLACTLLLDQQGAGLMQNTSNLDASTVQDTGMNDEIKRAHGN